MAEQRKNRKRVKKNRNRVSVRMIVILYVLVHGGFYLTGFHADQDRYISSKFRVPQELSPYKTVTLIRWDYAPSDRVMEVEFDINNLSYSTGELVFSCFYEGTKPLDCQVVYSSDTGLIIQIYDIPKEQGNRINVEFEYAPEEDKVFTASFVHYTGIMNVVKALPILKAEEYYNNRLTYDIAYYEYLIDIQTELISKDKEQIENIEKEVIRLKENTKELTAEERLHLNESIGNNEDMIRSFQKAIEEAEQTIANYQETIEVLEKRRLP